MSKYNVILLLALFLKNVNEKLVTVSLSQIILGNTQTSFHEILTEMHLC